MRTSFHGYFHQILCTRIYKSVAGPTGNRGVKETKNEELNDLYSSPDIFRVIKLRRMRWTGHVARMGKRRVVYRVIVGKPEGKRTLGRTRFRWEDNIKMDFQEHVAAWTGSS